MIIMFIPSYKVEAKTLQDLKNELADLKAKKAATEKISSSEKEIEEKDKETSELLKFLQVSNGENVYLEYLFEADSYTDFIY